MHAPELSASSLPSRAFLFTLPLDVHAPDRRGRTHHDSTATTTIFAHVEVVRASRSETARCLLASHLPAKRVRRACAGRSTLAANRVEPPPKPQHPHNSGSSTTPAAPPLPCPAPSYCPATHFPSTPHRPSSPSYSSADSPPACPAYPASTTATAEDSSNNITRPGKYPLTPTTERHIEQSSIGVAQTDGRLSGFPRAPSPLPHRSYHSTPPRHATTPLLPSHLLALRQSLGWRRTLDQTTVEPPPKPTTQPLHRTAPQIVLSARQVTRDINTKPLPLSNRPTPPPVPNRGTIAPSPPLARPASPLRPCAALAGDLSHRRLPPRPLLASSGTSGHDALLPKLAFLHVDFEHVESPRIHRPHGQSRPRRACPHRLDFESFGAPM